MDREQTKMIMRVLTNSYPNFKPVNMAETIDVWSSFFADYRYEQVASAVKSFIATDKNGFAPAIGQIIALIHTESSQQMPNEIEAWSLVSKAIRNSSYNSVEEWNNLPAVVQEAVGSPSQLRTWAIDENYNEDVISSQFTRCYRAVSTRQDQISRMPHETQERIAEANKNSYTAQIREKYSQATNTMIETKQAVETDDKHVENDKTVSDRLARFREEMAHD